MRLNITTRLLIAPTGGGSDKPSASCGSRDLTHRPCPGHTATLPGPGSHLVSKFVSYRDARVLHIRRNPVKQLAFPNGDTSYKSKNLWGLTERNDRTHRSRPVNNDPSRTICQVFACACGTEATSREANPCITLHAAAAFF